MANKISIFIKQRIWRLNLQELFSRTLGYFVIFVTALIYVQNLWQLPLKSIANESFSGLGIIVGLSALSFTMYPCLSQDKDKKALLYAGEKFFHSSLLLVQAIMLKYASEAVKESTLLHSLTRLTLIGSFSISLISVLCAVWATYLFLYGYNELNSLFWERYVQRIRVAALTDKKVD